MSTDKQSEVNEEQPEQLGPYQLEEQVPQSAHAPGELYLATHDTSGAMALVLKPADEKGSEALTDLRVHYVSSASPSYVALEVEHSPWSVAPEKRSVETLVCTFEDVREGVRRMARALHESNAPHRGWRLGLALTGAAALCALTFALERPSPESPPPEGPEAPLEVATDSAGPFMSNWTFIDIPDGGASVLAALPLPSKPFKGQRRPPCVPRVEVEINGGCWVPHVLKAPCPDNLYEHQGQCYLVSGQRPSPPQSLEP